MTGRQWFIDRISLPAFFKKNNINIFHRPSGYTMPKSDHVFKVLTVHDLRTLTIGDQYYKQNIEHYRKTLSTVDMCVVVSECTKRDLIEHMKMDEKKIRVTYLGADKKFAPAPKAQMEAVKQKYNLNEPFLLSVGSVPRKNISRILQSYAASAYKDKYLLVLSCYLEVQKHWQTAKDLGVSQRIRILDNVGNEDLVPLYSACQCFVFPSLYEGFGLPIVEAMQCGAPVITSNMSSCPEIAGDAAIFVDPNNVQEITDAIDQLCRNDNLRRELIQKGFERVKLFSWDRLAQEMKNIYAMA